MTANFKNICDKYIAKFGWAIKIFELKLNAANFARPVVNLIIRLWIANIFWTSGLLKLPEGFLGIGKGSWDSTLFLFEYEHPIPGFSPEIAAYLGTFFEILCPILIVLGLGTRFASIILLIMTAFIQITYQQHVTHLYWMMLLSVLMAYGAGTISLDNLIRKKSLSCKNYRKVANIAA